MVEPQPSKLMTWVRFPLPAPEQFELADVAQLVEHVLGKDEVTGSIPVVSSSFGWARFGWIEGFVRREAPLS